MLLEESDFCEDFRYSLSDSGTIIATDFHRKGYIFLHGLAGEELEILEYDTHTSSILEEFSLRELGDITSSIVIDLSLLRAYSTDHRSDDARLPTSRCSYEEDEFPTLDLDVDITEDTAFAV